MMKKTTIILCVFMFSMVSLMAQKTTWTFDKAHSKIQFDVAHMVISEVSGQFNGYEGTVSTTKKNFSDAKIDFSIDVKSIDTDDGERDEHLQSPDFFDAEKYPDITFKSISMEKIGDNKYKLTGDFTMHGVTNEIALEVNYGGTVTDPYGNVKAGFKVTGKIDRTDFGLKYNSLMDNGGLMIGEEVTITCRFELLKMK